MIFWRAITAPAGNLQVQARVNGIWVPASGNFVANSSHINQTLQVRIRDLNSVNSCTGLIHIEDKIAPLLACEDIFLNCAVTSYSPAYLLNELGIDNAYPGVDENCGNYTVSHIDNWFDLNCNGSINGITDLSGYIIRKWGRLLMPVKHLHLQPVYLLRPQAPLRSHHASQRNRGM